jgi:hypothetical protein
MGDRRISGRPKRFLSGFSSTRNDETFGFRVHVRNRSILNSFAPCTETSVRRVATRASAVYKFLTVDF